MFYILITLFRIIIFSIRLTTNLLLITPFYYLQNLSIRPFIRPMPWLIIMIALTQDRFGIWVILLLASAELKRSFAICLVILFSLFSQDFPTTPLFFSTTTLLLLEPLTPYLFLPPVNRVLYSYNINSALRAISFTSFKFPNTVIPILSLIYNFKPSTYHSTCWPSLSLRSLCSTSIMNSIVQSWIECSP